MSRVSLLDQRGENIPGKHLEGQASVLELTGQYKGPRHFSGGGSFSSPPYFLLVEPKGPLLKL